MSYLEIIKKFEGCSLKPYLCPAGKPTIGYGATYYPNGAPVKLSDQEITQDQAESILAFHVEQFTKGVRALLKHVPIDSNQEGALVSLAFNIGLEALSRSTLLKKVNANPNDLSIIEEFLRWDKRKGVSSPGLAKRRKAEAQLYFS